MNLNEAIKRLEGFVEDFRQAVVADDKTPLTNALALREEAVLIDNSTSLYNVVVFGDLNRFKGLNDQYGHDAGDVAINSAGEMLNRIVNEHLQSKAFRVSGDEFVCLLTHETLEGFLNSVGSFANIQFFYEEKSLKTAMSFGYAEADGKSGFTDLLARAEIACQMAKDEGDGFCRRWTPDVERNALVSLRARCLNCGARITCNVPKQAAPDKLRLCPSCGEVLN